MQLKFVNRDSINEGEILNVDKDSAERVIQLYGAFHAGDDYDVFADGKPVEVDHNGELVGKLP